MKEITLLVDSEKEQQLQSFLLDRKGVSRRLLTKLKRIDGGITRNGEPVRSIDTVFPGDEIVLHLEDGAALEPNGNLNVPVVFENESLVIFDKPGGMPVHPSIKHQGDTLGNFFAHCYPDMTFRPVNRLDRDTSGLCIAAKDAYAAKMLQGNCQKVYFAAIHGIPEERGTIDAPIARAQESIILRCVREDGKPSVTDYIRMKVGEHYSLMEVRPRTGRTHQIRVHFAYIGHPLAGDDMYGGSREDIGRQALHCGEIAFTDPLSGDKITVTSPIPDDMAKLFK